MNIQNTLVNFLGKVENKNSIDNRKTYLPPQKLDTFERTIQPQAKKENKILGTIANMYKKMSPIKLDETSSKIMVEDDLAPNKVFALAKDMTTSKTDRILLERAKCDGQNNYILKAENSDDTINIKLLDKDLNILEQENTKYVYDKKGYPTSKTVLTNDFRTNTFCETKFNIVDLHPEMISATKVKRDKQNRLIRKEIYEKSDIEGMFNVKYEFPNGKTRQISKATKDKNTGAILIEKDMRSSDMTRTQFRYEDDPNGNRIIDYKITSPNGKVLMNQSQSFEVLGDNKFRSSRNSKTYLIELNDKENKLNITDEKKNETSEIKLKDFVKGDDKKIANMLKTVSGDELIKLKNNVLGINEIQDKLKSYCKTEINLDLDNDNPDFDTPSLMFSRLAVTDDTFSFLHELGHAIDVGGKTFGMRKDEETGKLGLLVEGSLQDDKDLKKIYTEERQNFLKEFPTNEREHIGYFINNERGSSSTKRGRIETIAETNAILNTYQTTGSTSIRTQYLQQHFPRTIAYLSEKLAPTSEQ